MRLRVSAAAMMRIALSLVAALLVLCVAPHAAEARGHANLQRLFEQQLERQQEQEQLKLLQLSLGADASADDAAAAAAASSLRASTNVTTEWFTQTLDHFEFSATPRTFQQRFYSNFHFYRPGGPAFIYMGGEAELRSSCIDKGEIVVLAQEHGGALFGLEHRFYGQTQPFSTLASENLRYLTVEQALEDAANFITVMQARLETNSRGNPAQWFVVGGSYPGTLSAFMRTKYPHLVAGSLASSAPVHAKAEFWEYDQMVSQGAGPQCSDAIRSATHAIEALLDNPATEQSVKDLFGCGAIPQHDDVGFLYVLADAVSYAVQYTSSMPNSPNFHLLPLLCDRWMTNTSTGLDPTHSLASFFADLMKRTGEDCYSFSTLPQILNDTTVAPELNQRQWYWQSCLQYGFFQTAPNASIPGQPEPVRSTRIDLEYHLGLCRDAFGGAEMSPNTVATNARYGGLQPVGSRVLYTNGDVDPWSALGLTNNVSCCSSLVARLIHGTAHCADLYPSDPKNDPADLTAARLSIRAAVRQWIDPAEQNVDCPMFFEAETFADAPAEFGTRFLSCNGSCVDVSSDVFHCGSCDGAEDRHIDDSNASEWYCREGVLMRVQEKNSGVLSSREMLIIGICFLVVGFCMLTFGLHALRKVKTMKALMRYDALDEAQRAQVIAGSGHAVPIASTNAGALGWDREASRPLRGN